MATIEELYRQVKDHLEPCDGCDLDLRPLLVAVLEEAVCDCDGSHESNCPWLEQERCVRDLCARIEALPDA
jgi:hypothetical protein